MFTVSGKPTTSWEKSSAGAASRGYNCPGVAGTGVRAACSSGVHTTTSSHPTTWGRGWDPEHSTPSIATSSPNYNRFWLLVALGDIATTVR